MSTANQGILNLIYTMGNENIRTSYTVKETFTFWRSVTKHGTSLTPSFLEICLSSIGTSIEEPAFISMHHTVKSFEK